MAQQTVTREPPLKRLNPAGRATGRHARGRAGPSPDRATARAVPLLQRGHAGRVQRVDRRGASGSLGVGPAASAGPWVGRLLPAPEGCRSTAVTWEFVAAPPETVTTLAGPGGRAGVPTESERVVCVLTGHALESPAATVAYHGADQKTFDMVLGSRGARRAAFANRAIRVPNDPDEIIRAVEVCS
jgi:hypothetical protein